MIKSVIGNVSEGIVKLISDLVKSTEGNKALSNKMKHAFNSESIDKYQLSTTRINKVKTILNPDSIVDLSDIYFQDATLFEGKSREFFSQFKTKCVLIEGGPGQGKSLFLRHLFLKECNRGSYISIFIEFRNLKYEKKLKDELLDEIKDFGFKLDNSLFEFIAKSDKLLLVLDGFDEIPNNERLRVTRELEALAKKYSNLRLLISSRPDSGMGASVLFQKNAIEPMTLEMQERFISHLYDDKQCLDINKVLKESKFISEVTTSPLLLTLFTITYNNHQFKPDSLSEFYRLIFPTMLYRHDRMKIGFDRERKAGLNDYQMQRLFEAFSFLSLDNYSTRFSTPSFRKYLNQSIQLTRLNNNIEDLLILDITCITALIIPDGCEYFAFTHKSIQEYFSAEFIGNLNEERKIGFYKKVIKEPDEFGKWQNTLSFLETIDERNYTKYFLIPYKKQVLCLDCNGKVNITYAHYINLVGHDTKLGINEDGELTKIFWGDTLSSIIYKEYSQFTKNHTKKFIYSIKKQLAEHLSYCDINEYNYFRRGDNEYLLNLNSTIKALNKESEVCVEISNAFEGSKFKQEVLKIELELANSDKVADELLPF